MYHRLKELRNSLNMTQTAFGASIGATRSMIAAYESGKVTVPEPVVRLICREFNISYERLTDGIEPMLVPEDSLGMAALERIMSGKNEYVKAIFRELADMPDEWWEQAIAMLKRIEGKEKDR